MEPEQHPNCKVLVVDDQPSVRQVITRMLRHLGVGVVESAADGADAIRVLRSADEPFDLVLCDLSMPNEDGLVLLRNLASAHPKPSVVLMSGGDSLVLDAARRLGEGHGLSVLGTMAKPIQTATLSAFLRQHDGRVETVAVPGPVLAPVDLDHGLLNSQFEVWFQPLFHLGLRRVSGVEALVRLRHQDLGLVGPSSFITLAEQCGFIGRLTDYVMKHAVAWNAAWRRDGVALNVSINMSAATLNDLALPDRIEAICDRYAIPPDSITLELTESSLADSPAVLLDILTRIRLKGFRLSLDDFGTGYASLGQLRELPFHELKLDQRFVQDAVSTARSRLILEGGFRMASELGMTTVAEGVESEEAFQMVADLGCDVVQGALISMPMPASSIPAWLDTFSRELRAGRQLGVPASSDDSIIQHQRRASAHTAEIATLPLRTQAAEIVSRFSHDIASPLTIITTLGEMLMQDAPADDSRRTDFELLRQAGREAAEMVVELNKNAKRWV
jgi:EAL domain-containing protein (putative c-di-GMP-specific phosphodiesterase class I)/ActR/RegA family two-component response regulator